jgi:hypothetical protein
MSIRAEEPVFLTLALRAKRLASCEFFRPLPGFARAALSVYRRGTHFSVF